MAMIEEPEWVEDMYDTFLELDLQLLDRVWDAGYRFDEVNWPNDMGYKHNQFFSMNTFRALDSPASAPSPGRTTKARWRGCTPAGISIPSCRADRHRPDGSTR